MRNPSLVRFVVAVVAAAALAAPAAAGSGPYEGMPASLSLTKSSPQSAVLTAASVQAGDTIFYLGPEPPASGLEWSRRADAERVRWEAQARTAGALQLDIDVSALLPGTSLVIGVDRTLGDGSTLQSSRQLVVDEAGVVHEGAASAARIRRGFLITPTPGATLPQGLALDAAGRVRLGLRDPALAAVLADAREVVPYLTAEVMAGTAIDSVSGTNQQNTPFTDEQCGGPYYGSAVYISTAPPSATVTSTDISYSVYHSVDISDFQVAGFRGGFGGYNQTDYVILYQRTQTGSNTLTESHTGLSDYNGRLVNYQYIVGCCNYQNTNYAYLDEWSITLYFQSSSSPTIDLVADSVVVSPATVAAGASLSAIFTGHVAGSGTVGGPFGIGFYLSPDTNITTGDVHLRTLTDTWATSPGDTFGYGSPGTSLTIPGGTAPGSYYIGMIVDNGGAIDEVNESNNVAWTPITVASSTAKPNLVAVSCSVSPTSADAGDTVSFTSRGRNSGTVGSSSFVWAIYLSNDANINPASDTGLMALDYPGGWDAGADTGDVTRSVTLPNNLSDGTYYLGIYYDAYNQVSETNEGDNACAAALTIGSGGGGTSDKIWIVPAAAAATGFGGAQWTGQIAITNPTPAPRTATVYYVPKGQPWPGTVLSGPHTIGVNQSLFIDNPVGALTPTTGLLYVVVDQWGPRVNSRVFVLNADSSTYGQGIPGIPMTATPAGPQVIGPVHSQPGVYHANLGLVHPTTGSYTVEVSIYSAGGALLAVKSFSRSQAWEQIDNVFQNMGLGTLNVQGAWIKVRLTGGSNVLAYISLVDDRTKDPTFLLDLSTLLP